MQFNVDCSKIQAVPPAFIHMHARLLQIHSQIQTQLFWNFNVAQWKCVPLEGLPVTKLTRPDEAIHFADDFRLISCSC